MRKIILLFIMSLGIASMAFSQVGIGTTTPDTSAMLDIRSINKGLLPPRVALTATNVASPIKNPAKFLLVCNIDTAGTPPYNVVPGYYYWADSIWHLVVNKGTKPGDMEYWDGTKWIMIPGGMQGQVLTWCGGRPVWGGCANAVTLQPGAEGINAYIFTTFGCNNAGDVNWGQDSILSISAWTFNANGCPFGVNRSLIKFAGIDSLPPNAFIVSAKLTLYGSDSTARFGSSDSYYPGTPYPNTNGVLVQRVTAPWDEATVTYNTQPTATTQDQDSIPPSTSRWNYNATIDVTNLVRDMRSTNNYGFLLQMEIEQYYRQMAFVSSDASDATKHPKLVIQYELQ